MGIIQDSLLGAHEMSKPDTFINKADFMQLMMQLDETDGILPIPAILKPEVMFTGKQVLSLILPKFTMKHEANDVYIKDGELLKGVLCKKTLGPTSNGIIHTIAKLLSNETAMDFMHNIQKVVNSWLQKCGYSVALDDCMTDEITRAKLDNVIESTIEHVTEVENLGKSLHIPLNQREKASQQILGKILSRTGGILQKSMKQKNMLHSMIAAQSKGTVINIAQISACVSQQSVDGTRIFNKDNPTERSLGCFAHNIDTPESKGFIKHSYMEGLQPAEEYFHDVFQFCLCFIVLGEFCSSKNFYFNFFFVFYCLIFVFRYVLLVYFPAKFIFLFTNKK